MLCLTAVCLITEVTEPDLRSRVIGGQRQKLYSGLNYGPYLPLYTTSRETYIEVNQFCHRNLRLSGWFSCFIFGRSCIKISIRRPAVLAGFSYSFSVPLGKCRDSHRNRILTYAVGPDLSPWSHFPSQGGELFVYTGYVLFVVDNNTNTVLRHATWAWLVHFVTCLSTEGLKFGRE
jgi:hypothetical protein